MDCTQLQRDLQLVLDDELDVSQAESVARHLETCSDCRDRVERGREFDTWIRHRLQASDAAPATLRTAIRDHFAAAPPRPRLVRMLGSPWTPRLAMAAVLALMVAAPLLWLPKRAGALATTAAEQHACHGGAPGDPLPPCCTAVPIGVGGRLGEPSPGVVVPDLGSSGLAWQGTTRCSFAPKPVHMMVFTDAAGGRFSLYTTAHGTREFDIVRPRAGGPGWIRRSIALAPDAHHGAAQLEVTMWENGGTVWSWVGPAGTTYETALRALHR